MGAPDSPIFPAWQNVLKLRMRIKPSAPQTEMPGQALPDKACIEQEVVGGNFQDVRLARRFSKLLRMAIDGIGKSVP